MLLAVLTVSDRCSQGLTKDTAGPAVAALLREQWPLSQLLTALVPDEEALIASQLASLAAQGARLILTVGGTGLGPRDRTPEATRRLLDREAPGLAEAMRALGAKSNPYAWLSRGLAGLTASGALIVNLPGSRRGATESLASILFLLNHALEVASGGQLHP
jgi:molybdenum cofactor synthesis domain-containing protein